MFNVEFIGGPFDGHRQACSANPGKLPFELIRLVCDDAFDQLDGATRVRSGTFTSVALYELEQKKDAIR